MMCQVITIKNIGVKSVQENKVKVAGFLLLAVFLASCDGADTVAEKQSKSTLLSSESPLAGENTGPRFSKLELPQGFIPTRIHFNADGSALAVECSNQKTVLLYDTHSGTVSAQIEGIVKSRTQGLGSCFSRDGRRLCCYSGISPKSIQVWDVSPPKKVFEANPMKRGSSVELSPDGSHLVAWEYHEMQLIKVEDGSLVNQYKTNGKDFSHVKFSPDGKTFITAGGEDKAIRVWETATGEQTRQLGKRRFGDVGALAFSEDGGSLFIKQWHNGKVTALDVETEAVKGEAKIIDGFDFSQEESVLRLLDWAPPNAPRVEIDSLRDYLKSVQPRDDDNHAIDVLACCTSENGLVVGWGDAFFREKFGNKEGCFVFVKQYEADGSSIQLEMESDEPLLSAAARNGSVIATYAKPDKKFIKIFDVANLLAIRRVEMLAEQKALEEKNRREHELAMAKAKAEAEEREKKSRLARNQSPLWDDVEDLELVLQGFGGVNNDSLGKLCRFITPENARKASGDRFDREEAAEYALKHKDELHEKLFIIQRKASWDTREDQAAKAYWESLRGGKEDLIRLRVPLFFDVSIAGAPEFIGKSRYGSDIYIPMNGRAINEYSSPLAAINAALQDFRNGGTYGIGEAFNQSDLLLFVSGSREKVKSVARGAEQLVVNICISGLEASQPKTFGYYNWRNILAKGYNSEKVERELLILPKPAPLVPPEYQRPFPKAVLRRIEVIRATPESREVILEWAAET